LMWARDWTTTWKRKTIDSFTVYRWAEVGSYLHWNELQLVSDPPHV